MSEWKKTEKFYIVEEMLHGYNPYWWGVYASLNNLGENNHGIYRTILRIAKNKQRKLKKYTHVLNNKFAM